ncbi:MAG: hypothetical protein LBR11_12705 [Deltaproteobacteria bacterium]|jgi:hypothetical protein|nr:hypothetical protein [Deltaproteobacteria bacterium]
MENPSQARFKPAIFSQPGFFSLSPSPPLGSRSLNPISPEGSPRLASSRP